MNKYERINLRRRVSTRLTSLLWLLDKSDRRDSPLLLHSLYVNYLIMKHHDPQNSILAVIDKNKEIKKEFFKIKTTEHRNQIANKFRRF